MTPATALYLARRAGCRLPSPAEWRAALDLARRSADPIARGFATAGWKLRTAGDFTALLASPAHDPAARPDGGAFPGGPPTDAVWTAAALAKLGGTAAGDCPTPPPAWPLSTLESTDGFGFRPVGGTDDYAGVFHDLVGNVAQIVVDVPPSLAEQIDPRRATAAAVRQWFTPDRPVAVVGGSAVSAPAVDPTQPYQWPAAGPPQLRRRRLPPCLHRPRRPPRRGLDRPAADAVRGRPIVAGPGRTPVPLAVPSPRPPEVAPRSRTTVRSRFTLPVAGPAKPDATRHL